jgi:hypothetical protein
MALRRRLSPGLPLSDNVLIITITDNAKKQVFYTLQTAFILVFKNIWATYESGQACNIH